MTTKQLPAAVRATLTIIGDYERAAERSREIAASIEVANKVYNYDPVDYADRKLRAGEHRRAAEHYQAEADRLRSYLPKD